MSISVFVIRTFGFALMALASLGVCASASAGPLFYGTSLNALGQELLIQADAGAGQIISTRGLMAVNVWPFKTNIAFGPDGTMWGTSLNALGQELLIQIDPAAGQIISTRGLMAVDVWPFETEIAFPPAPANGAVPEPSSLAMLVIGLGAIAAVRRTRNRAPRSDLT